MLQYGLNAGCLIWLTVDKLFAAIMAPGYIKSATGNFTAHSSSWLLS
jgi:hypothetical protein